jgi:hypothetical protein
VVRRQRVRAIARVKISVLFIKNPITGFMYWKSDVQVFGLILKRGKNLLVRGNPG